MSDDLADNQPYNEWMARIELSEKCILEAGAEAMRDEKDIYHSTLYGLAVARRALGISNGFRAMVEQKNTVCAVPLVRLQVDSALRLHAGEMVRDPEEFSRAVMQGEQIDRIKGRDKQHLKDRILVLSLAQRHPWIREVYKQTSGGVHLSERHIFEMLRPTDGRDVRILISPIDHDREPEFYREPMQCMGHLNEIIAGDLQRWFSAKSTRKGAPTTMPGPASARPASAASSPDPGRVHPRSRS